jgi:hypothetical protein
MKETSFTQRVDNIISKIQVSQKVGHLKKDLWRSNQKEYLARELEKSKTEQSTNSNRLVNRTKFINTDYNSYHTSRPILKKKSRGVPLSRTRNDGASNNEDKPINLNLLSTPVAEAPMGRPLPSVGTYNPKYTELFP